MSPSRDTSTPTATVFSCCCCFAGRRLRREEQERWRRWVQAPQPVEQIEMDPIKINGGARAETALHLETYDVTELLEHAGAALSERRFDDAVT